MLRNGYVGDFGPEFLAGTAEYERRDSLQNPVGQFEEPRAFERFVIP